MKVKIKSQAHRKFKHLKNYTSLNYNSLPDGFQDITLQESENLIGIYATEIQGNTDSLLLTNYSAYINKDGKIKIVPWTLLQSVDSPPIEQKYTAESLKLTLHSGEIVEVPIRGGRGNLRDVWAFVSFFKQVILILALGRAPEER